MAKKIAPNTVDEFVVRLEIQQALEHANSLVIAIGDPELRSHLRKLGIKSERKCLELQNRVYSDSARQAKRDTAPSGFEAIFLAPK